MSALGYQPERVAQAYDVYLKHAEQCMQEMPEHYAKIVLEAGPKANADRTFEAINNHVRGVRHLMIDQSPSWKRTCKSLGIKHTYKAIEAWLRGES